MNQCTRCGHRRRGLERKCPNCDIFYSQIDAFLEEEDAKELHDTFKARMGRVANATDRKKALYDEWAVFYQSMPRGSTFILYVVMTFVFMLILVVL
jgi:hypothetical protein